MPSVSTSNGLSALLHQAAYYQRNLLYLSIVGSREEVSAILSALLSHREIYVEQKPLHPGWQDNKTYMARLGKGVVHGLFISRRYQFYVGPQERLHHWLAQQMQMPVLPQWVPYLKAHPELASLNKDVQAYNTHALLGSPSLWSELREYLCQQLAKGRLPLPPEAQHSLLEDA